MTVLPRASAVWILSSTVTLTERAFRLLDQRQWPSEKSPLLLVFTYVKVNLVCIDKKCGPYLTQLELLVGTHWEMIANSEERVSESKTVRIAG